MRKMCCRATQYGLLLVPATRADLTREFNHTDGDLPEVQKEMNAWHVKAGVRTAFRIRDGLNIKARSGRVDS